MNEVERKAHLACYFTADGLEALENRLKNLAELYMKDENYPLEKKMYGFPTLKVNSKKHLEGMIDNLTQLLCLKEISIEG